jgi:hypothetical protein
LRLEPLRRQDAAIFTGGIRVETGALRTNMGSSMDKGFGEIKE